MKNYYRYLEQIYDGKKIEMTSKKMSPMQKKHKMNLFNQAVEDGIIICVKRHVAVTYFTNIMNPKQFTKKRILHRKHDAVLLFKNNEVHVFNKIEFERIT